MSWPVNADFMRDTNKAELGKLQCSKLVVTTSLLHLNVYRVVHENPALSDRARVNLWFKLIVMSVIVVTLNNTF